MSIQQEQFRVSLDAFDGPLDLLLYLVQRAEVDIHDISIAQITNEYLEMLRVGVAVDVEMAGEFLVMAATLIEMKSRSLIPVEQVAQDDQTMEQESMVDPRGDLIRQLLAFQQFRTASADLEKGRIAFSQRYDVRVAVAKQIQEDHEPSLELDDVHFLDLSDAYEYIASSIDFSRLGDHHIVFDDTPIELCQEDLLDRLQRSSNKQLTLQSTFAGLPILERVGMFLATLELVRLRKVTVQQDLNVDEIIIVLLEAEIMNDELTAQASELL